ncbi:unnamed protein product, partial [Trichogramma brassicae]
MKQRREWKICLESERSSSVRAERDILEDVYVGLTSTARVSKIVARVKSASAGTSRPECEREPVDPTAEQTTRTTTGGSGPGEDLDVSCGESGRPSLRSLCFVSRTRPRVCQGYDRCVCRRPGIRVLSEARLAMHPITDCLPYSRTNTKMYRLLNEAVLYLT